MMNNLADAHFCVQQFHADDATHAQIHKQIMSDDDSMAIFLQNVLWEV